MTKRQRDRALREAREGRAACFDALRKLRAEGHSILHHVFLRSARIHHRAIMRAVWGEALLDRAIRQFERDRLVRVCAFAPEWEV